MNVPILSFKANIQTNQKRNFEKNLQYAAKWFVSVFVLHSAHSNNILVNEGHGPRPYSEKSESFRTRFRLGTQTNYLKWWGPISCC